MTIRGAGFAAGAAVTIGGRAATEVSVRGSDKLTAKTPASTSRRPSGHRRDAERPHSGTLAGGFRYEPASRPTPRQ